jgi:hypothetical protein
LAAAEFLAGTAQDFAALEVVGHAAIAQVDAVVQEQAVLAWGLQMVGGGQGAAG